MNLFDKLPENFFSVLSRKYKAVYSFALLTLFETLKVYKSKIKKADYLSALRAHGEDIMGLFDVNLDKLDDKPDEEDIPFVIDDSALSGKINYIFRKLCSTGWIDVERETQSNIDYIYLPSYAIRMLQLISELSSDTALYVPLVHQTFSELSLENEKEDDYMFRSLVSARKNADDLELNVTLLHHSICVFGHNLSNVFDPNEVLRQHFDIFKNQVGDKVYHPMKTYDSLGLYSLPVMAILKRWQHDTRIMAKLVSQAKYDPSYTKMKASEINIEINRMLQETIDIFSRLSSSFEEIDQANAKYTKAVQKKVNFLSSSDKTIKGKLDAVILQMAKALDKTPAGPGSNIDDIPIVLEASKTISIYHQGFVDSDCLTMPFKRTIKEEMDPMPLEDQFAGDDDLMNAFLENEVNMFSFEAIEAFMLKAFGNRKVIETKDIPIEDMNQMILLILGTVRAEFGDMFYTIEKIGDQTRNGRFLMPDYRFTRKGKV
ncbi:MAG: DUF5716 family protein [Bacilli bacterium]|nr:DUF5716 family protein [Bacilli bacterium]